MAATPSEAPRIYMLRMDAEFRNVIRLSACHPMFLIEHFSVLCMTCNRTFRVYPTSGDVGDGFYDEENQAFRPRDRYNLHEDGSHIYRQTHAPHKCNLDDPDAKTVKISYIEGWIRELSDTNYLGVPILALKCCDIFRLESATLSHQFPWNIRTANHQHIDVHPDFGNERGRHGMTAVVGGVDDHGDEYRVAVHYYLQSGSDIRGLHSLRPPQPTCNPALGRGSVIKIRGFWPDSEARDGDA